MKNILHIIPFRRLLLITTLFLGLASQASAHALLDYSVPKVGSTLTNSPDKILICFTQNLKLRGSWIRVHNSKGKPVDKNDSHSDPKDWSKLIVSLPTLPPDTYKVTWHAVADDNHATDGHFKFTVK